MSALLTDLYQLTMAAGYLEAGKASDRATFELFVRRLPPNRNFVIAAGLAQAADYLLNFHFSKEDVDYLRSLPQFSRARRDFFDLLEGLRFTGDMFAAREGTPVFANEPLMTIRAPMIEAQIPETFLLATLGFQSMIAAKAARVVKAALGRAVVEFGTRRAHSPEAGVLAGRAAYIGGCVGTSNTEAGRRFDVPVFGTAAHSWTMSFSTEMEAFRQLQRLLGPATVYLVDSYDTLEGARRAASLGEPLWGVRLDSGNLVELAPAVREILDRAGLGNARIMATGDLNEYKIQELMAADAPIDAFGVGTELATSADAPNLGVVYKLVEMENADGRRYTAKLSEDKHTLPGSKQVFRFADHDRIARSTECVSCPPGSAEVEALLRPVIIGGRLVEPLPTPKEARDYCAQALAKLPSACHSLFATEEVYRVEYSQELLALYDRVRTSLNGVSA